MRAEENLTGLLREPRAEAAGELLCGGRSFKEAFRASSAGADPVMLGVDEPGVDSPLLRSAAESRRRDRDGRIRLRRTVHHVQVDPALATRTATGFPWLSVRTAMHPRAAIVASLSSCAGSSL